MDNKRILLLVFSAVLVVGFMFSVGATVTVFTNSTLNNTNISGTHLIYFNMTGCLAQCHIGNISINWTYYNGTSFYVTTVNNVTQNQTNFTYSWDTTTFSDSKNGTLNFTAITYPNNATINATNSTAGIDLDNTAPVIAVYSGATLTAYANTSIKTAATFANNLTLNVSVTDATLFLNGNWTDAYCTVNVNGGLNHSIPFTANRWCNSSDINITGLSDGNNTIRIWVNDSINTLANSTLVVHVDTTSPTSSASCSPSSIQTGVAFPCSCSASDATSGVSTNNGASTSGSNTTTTSTGVFTWTCTATDNGGLTATSTATYTVNQPTSGSSGSAGASSSAPKPFISNIGTLIPGESSITKYTDTETGVKEIEINVNNPAQNVKITVTKYEDKPAAVTVEKTGKVYKYMQIHVDGVQDKLKNAKLQFKVEKDSVTDKDKVIVSKFDEVAGEWNDLPTTFNSEDSKFYYYDTEVSSFSYFAISEPVAAGSSGGTTGTGTTPQSSGGMSTWVWVLISVVVLGVIWAFMRRRNN